jgi:hypothetical protein
MKRRIEKNLVVFWKVFITRADDDVARLEQLDEEMTQSYQNLCDFLAIDSKNYSLTEFFTDLKSFCSFFSVCSSLKQNSFISSYSFLDMSSRSSSMAGTSNQSSENLVSIFYQKKENKLFTRE